MDVNDIDTTFNQLQTESQQTVSLLTTLAGKLQTAAQAGNTDAREWMLDLKEIAIGFQNEQNQTSNLFQQLHAFIGQLEQQQPQYQQPQFGQPEPQYQQPQQYQQPAYQQPQYQPAGGGMVQRFMSGGFGRAIATGAGFGIGDDLINKIF